MNVSVLSPVDRQQALVGMARHVRQRRQRRRDPVIASRLSLGTLQALMGLAAYQARAR